MSPTSDDLIVQTAKRDAHAGVERAIEIIRASYSRPVAAALVALVNTAVNTLRVLDAIEPEVRFVLEYAHRYNKGDDVRALVREAWPELVQRKRLHLMVRLKDPHFAPIEHAFVAAFERRLPDLARMAAVENPKDYDDMVRRALPDPVYAHQIVTENAALVYGIIAHVSKHPHLLRVPSGLVGKLADAAREMVDWEVAKVRRGLDEIYAPQPSA